MRFCFFHRAKKFRVWEFRNARDVCRASNISSFFSCMQPPFCFLRNREACDELFFVFLYLHAGNVGRCKKSRTFCALWCATGWSSEIFPFVSNGIGAWWFLQIVRTQRISYRNCKYTKIFNSYRLFSHIVFRLVKLNYPSPRSTFWIHEIAWHRNDC